MEPCKGALLVFWVTYLALTECVLTNSNTVSRTPSSAASQSELTAAVDRAEFEICADVGGVIYYCPGDEVCCIPGDPASRCCPSTKPVCINNEYCCATGYPKLCGDYCCPLDSYCCEEGGCCPSEDQCCGPNQCCSGPEQALCCTGPSDSNMCCDKDTMACCGTEYGCVAPCEVQFDALGCTLEAPDMHVDTAGVGVPWGCQTVAETSTLYRILRTVESCDVGLLAKNLVATKEVISHVNCGSRSGYASQYISFTTSLEAANYYRAKFGSTNRIAQVKMEDIPPQCAIIDFNVEAIRDEHLGNAVCKNYAKASCEVLLSCGEVPVPCTVHALDDVSPMDAHSWL